MLLLKRVAAQPKAKAEIHGTVTLRKTGISRSLAAESDYLETDWRRWIAPDGKNREATKLF
jgi:hypothetical protein